MASNGTVNIGATAPVTNYTFVMAGFGFTTGPGGTGMVAPQLTPLPTSLTNGASSVVNFTPAAANGTLYLDQLDAAGAVNNSANLEPVRGRTLARSCSRTVHEQRYAD